MAANFDVVVAGAGHNSLITAGYLAKAGLKILVLEQNEWLGGGVVTRELTVPGFRHDQHSTGHMLIQANPLILKDELELQAKFGLNYIRPEVTVATIFDDQSTLLTYFDLDKTCESIARLSSKDAEAYRRHVEKMSALLPMFVSGLFAPPLPFGAFMGLLEQSRQGRDLIGVMNRSAFDIIDSMFENDKVKIHFMKYSSEAMAGPEEKGTGLVFSMLVGFAHSFKGGLPEGGAAGLTDALVRCIEHHGGEVRTRSRVARVLIEGGRAAGVVMDGGEEIRAKRAVVGCFHPHLLGDYVAGLDPEIVADARRTEPGPYSLFVSNYALNRPPSFPALEGTPAALINECLTSNMDEFRREFDDLRYGLVPKGTGLVAIDHGRHDPSRTPPGKAILYISSFAPYQLADGGPERWDEIREQVADQTLEQVRRFTPDMGDDNIIARHIGTPLDHVRTSPSFQQGDVSGIGRYLYQFLGRRPTPELSGFAVPGVEGLYLVGPFMHPGGGVIGGGRAVAVRMFDDLGLDLEKTVGR